MNTKIKLITIILMTLAVLGGGVVYFTNQLQSKDPAAVSKFVAWFSESQRPQAVTPEMQSDQIAKHKGMKTHKDGSLSDLYDTNLSVSVDKSSSTAVQGANSGAVIVASRTGKKDQISSSGSAQGGGDLMAFNGRRSGSSGEVSSSVSGGSNVMVTGSPMRVPFKDGWALIDPEPLENKPEDQILPVGNGIYALSLLSLLYGLLLFLRRRG